jgi:hypothetical protein
VGERGKERVTTAVVVIIDPAIRSPSARHTKNNTDAHFLSIKIIATFSKLHFYK